MKKQPAWNRKQSAEQFVRKYQHRFEAKEDAIDLREMAKNYQSSHGIIPLEDIHEGILALIGPKYSLDTKEYDPSYGAVITYTKPAQGPLFGYVGWKDLFLWPIFQRDVAPNHIEKIYKDFDHTAVIVPCAIKITLKDGRTVFCVWDGHHTLQVCRLQGYTKFALWYIDVDAVPDEVILAAGFDLSDDGRIKYGAWVAGTNMRRINGKNKRPMSPYDDFMVGYETRDYQYTSMMNILKKNQCVPKRHATCAGAFTQIKSGIECYELADTYGNRGIYWDRALNFHRTHWPQAHLVLEVFRPMTMLYHQATIQGIALTQEFDTELAGMLQQRWGDPESVQEGIKESFWNAMNSRVLVGQIPDHDKERVLAGIINFYKQNGGQQMLPIPSCQWKV